MPIFTAAAAAIVSTTALTGLAATIATNIIAVGLLVGTNQLLGLDEVDGPAAPVDEGVDVRLGANTQNRLPILYGDFQSRGIVCFYTLSESKQSLTTVLALGEGPITSIDEVLWEDYTLTLDANGVVTNATRLVGTETETTDKYNGKISVQLNPAGGRSTYLEGITSDWTSAHTMSNIAYVIVSIDYDREAGIVGLSDMRFRGTGAVDNPATAVRNLLQNSVYGVGLPDASIDIDSFDTAVAYFNEQVSFDNDTETQKRSRLNGVLNASDTVSRRIGIILEGCNSSLRWYNGQWGLFIDKEDNATSFTFDTDNIIGSINVVETGLTNLYNRMVIEYGRGVENNYQRATVELLTPDAVRYPNEIDRTINLSLPLVNNSTEATAIGTVILNKGRQQLSVSHRADVTAMPLEPGDVVRYNDEDYGWSNKLFRVISVAEIYENGALSYEIQSVEYADAVYDYGVLNAHDVSPNAATVSVEDIDPVDDLSIAGVVQTAATPFISLQWTSPATSLVEQFFVFYNAENATFSSQNTKLGGVEQLPSGNYNAGDVVTHQLVGVPAGDVSIWVVASNDFVTSTESNRALVSGWRPIVSQDAVFEQVTRYNETPSVIAGVDIDVGAPPANATGIGTGRNNVTEDTGWYEFIPDETDRPNAPVWTANTEVERSNAEPRVLDFTITGVSGDEIEVLADIAQITDFDFSGTTGNRELQYLARPQVDTFTFSGQAAEADNVDPGLAEVWDIVTTGSTDVTQADQMEQFFIHPQGTSSSYTGEQFIFTPDSGSTNTFTGTPQNVVLTSTGSTSTGGVFGDADYTYQVFSPGTAGFFQSGSISDPFNPDLNYSTELRIRIYPTDYSATISQLNSIFGISATDNSNIGFTRRPEWSNIEVTLSNENSMGSYRNISFLSVFGNIAGTSFIEFQRDNASTFSKSGDLISSGDNLIVTVIDGNYTASSITLTLGLEINQYVLDDSIIGGVAVGTALNTAIGTDYNTDWTKSFDATTGVITFTANDLDSYANTVSVIQGTQGTIAVSLVSTDAILPVQSSVDITLDGDANSYMLANNLVGPIPIGTALNTAIGTDYDDDWVKTFDATTGEITFTAIESNDKSGSLVTNKGSNGTFNITTVNNAVVGAQSSIQLVISTESIDETILIPSNITGTPLFNNILAQLQAITDITDEFTVDSVTVDIPGTNDAVVIRLTANDLTNHTLATTISSGLTGTTSGSILDGQESSTATTIRIDYDADLNPIQQNITFGANATPALVAANLASEINMHGQLIAVQGTNFTTTSQVVSFGGVSYPPSFDNINVDTNEEYIGTSGTPSGSQFTTNSITTSLVTSMVSTNTAVTFVGNYFMFFNGSTSYAIYEVTSISGSTYGLSYLDSLGLDTLIIGTTYDHGSGLPSAFGNDGPIIEIVSTDFIEDLTASSVLVKPTIVGEQDTPVITITTQGTGDATFVLSTRLQGRNLGTSGAAFSTYDVLLQGTSLSSGVFSSGASATSAAEQIFNVVNDTSQFTATRSGAILTVTSVGNNTNSLTITIVAGSNEMGKTSTNDLATTKAVSMLGSTTDVFGGEDTVVTVRVGTGTYYTQTYAGDALNDVILDIEEGIDAINTDFVNRFSAAIDGTTLTATAASFVGPEPQITISVSAGSTATTDAVGNVTITNATIAIIRTVVSDGSETQVQSGELSTYTITQGTDVLVTNAELTGASSAAQSAILIAASIRDAVESKYNAIANNGIITATLDENNDTPDLTVTLTAGLNTDDTAASILISKTIDREGDVGAIDLTTALWTYAITSPTTDDDTTMITPDGTIAVRRGLFLNSLAASRDGQNDNNNQVVFGLDLYTTASQSSIIDLTGVLHFYVAITEATDDISVFLQAIMQFTTDTDDLDNATWTTIDGAISNRAFAIVITGDTRIGAHQYVSISFAKDNYDGLSPSTEYAFRILLQGIKSGVAVTVPNNVANLLYGTFQLQEILTVT